MAGPIVCQREVVCDAPPDVVWRVVGDTNRVNEALGYETLCVEPLDGPGAARFLIKTKLGGFPVEYEEYPFEWVAERRQIVKRVMRKGQVKSLDMRFELEPAGEGRTKLTLVLAVEPKLALLRPIARLQTQKQLARLADTVIRMIDTLARAPAGELVTASSDVGLRRSHAGATELERAAGSLIEQAGEAAAPLARRLVDLVARGADADLVRLRPFELADAWKADRRQVTTVCLQAVVAGLLELNWDLVCPSCQTASGRADHLADVADHASCQLCDISFGVDFDSTVEATFRPAAAVRKIAQGPFCIGGAARTPHVMAQVVLAPDGRAEVTAPGAPGRYRLFLRGGAATSLEVAPGGDKSAKLIAGEGLEPARLSLAPGATIAVEHRGKDARHLKLERMDFANRAATAHFIHTLPAFRRLFSGEALRPGVVLKVTRVAVLFSDLVGSTALYARVGDATAFRIVLDHFELLGKAIEAHAGAIVKTIGDAVMAIFTDERDAVAAAVAMQRAYAAYRAGVNEAGETDLKVGVFSGPCYAVNANKMTDYFGQSVNIAARLQAQAGAGEIVLPDDLAERALAGGWLEGAQVTERFEVILKGIEGATRAARVVLAGGARTGVASAG